jgi:hypothetical protein
MLKYNALPTFLRQLALLSPLSALYILCSTTNLKIQILYKITSHTHATITRPVFYLFIVWLFFSDAL